MAQASAPLEVEMKIVCHCGTTMKLDSHKTLEDMVEQTYHCPKCGEKVVVTKNRRWEETLGG